MIVKALLLSVACGLVCCSELHDVQVSAGPAPVVTATSSQYFERIFNRLVAAAPVFEPLPFAPAAPVIPVAQPPPVVVEATRTTVLTAPTNPPQNVASNPNIAIAIATAHAAPVATILLPPYPFGLPPSYVLPQPANDFPTENPNKESTTPKPNLPRPTDKTTTQREPEATTPISSNIDNNFIQALPSGQHFNTFRQYLTPPPAVPVQKPQKIKTTIEVVPVPLTYIAPPPFNFHNHHHQPHHHHLSSLKAVPHYHTFVPKTKIIIRPVSAPLKTRVIRVMVPSRLNYSSRKLVQTSLPNPRDPEPTTFRPFKRPYTKPPRL